MVMKRSNYMEDHLEFICTFLLFIDNLPKTMSNIHLD